MSPVDVSEDSEHLFVQHFDYTLLEVWRELRIMFCGEELFVDDSV